MFRGKKSNLNIYNFRQLEKLFQIRTFTFQQMWLFSRLVSPEIFGCFLLWIIILIPRVMTASMGSIITVMNDEEHQLNPSNQMESSCKIVQTQTLSAPFIVANNYMLFSWQKTREWQIIVSPFEFFFPDLFQTKQPQRTGSHASTL